MAIYAFTSITANYIPKAGVLAGQIRELSPDVRRVLALGEFETVAASGWDEVVGLKDLGLADLRSWTFRHRLVELCTAIKGRVLQMLLERGDCEAVFYFDPDIILLSPIEVLAERFAGASVLLTPHLTDPEPSIEGVLDNEMAALKHGTYNLGFLAVRNTAEGRRVADWWWSRLRHFCRDDIPRGLFTDQRWMDLAVGFFPSVEVVRDPGWNVATWNLSGRWVEGSLEEGLSVNGEPLRFYHFSGLDSGAQLAMLRKYGKRMSALFELRDWYLAECAALEPHNPEVREWPLGRYDNGEPITEPQRRLYGLRSDLQQAFPDPYSTSDVNASYYHWYAANAVSEKGGDTPAESCLAAEYRAELDRIHASRSWRLASRIASAWRSVSSLLHRTAS
jgi:hypothetical protein